MMTEADLDIQDEVDQQLTSSMHEVKPPAPKAILPSKSSVQTRPPMKIGMSLELLNTIKPIFSTSSDAQFPVQVPKAGTTTGAKIARFATSDDEDSEESSSDSSKDDEPDENHSNAHLDEYGDTSFYNSQTKSTKSNSNSNASDSDYGSSKDDDSEFSIKKARNELAAQIAQMANGSSEPSQPVPSSKPMVATQPLSTMNEDNKEKEKKAKARVAGVGMKGKKSNRQISGYNFKQPV